LTRVRTIWREWWHNRRRHSHCCGEGIRGVARGVTVGDTHGNHLEEDPSQVGASCLGVEGKAGHQDQEASSQEGGNQDQGEKADGLRKVVSGCTLGKFRIGIDCWTYVHRTREGEGVHRIHREVPYPWEVHSWVVVDQDVEDRNRNLQEGGRCQIRRQP